MKILRCFVVVSLLSLTSLSAQSSGPDERRITDPLSVDSAVNPDAHPIPIDDLYFTRSVGSAAWSPDGKAISFTTNMAGRSNLWKVDANGGWPIQLVQSDERQFSGAWSPDGKWIVFEQDFGGNELWDILAVPSRGGAVMNLTNTPDIREESPQWSPDGKTIAIVYSYVDSKKIGITGGSSIRRLLISPDGKTLLVTSNQKGGYENIALLDIPMRKLTWVSDTKWEAHSGDFSPSGKSFTYSINADGYGGFMTLMAIGNGSWSPGATTARLCTPIVTR